MAELKKVNAEHLTIIYRMIQSLGVPTTAEEPAGAVASPSPPPTAVWSPLEVRTGYEGAFQKENYGPR